MTAKRIIIIVFFLCFSAHSFAVDYVSNGTGNWNAGTTWLPVGVPVAGDNVTINLTHTVTVTANAACTNLTITGDLRVGGFSFDVSGLTTLSGTIIVTSAIGIKTFGNISISNGIWTNNAAETYTISGTVTMSGCTVNGTATGIFNIGADLNVTTGTINTLNAISLNITGTTTVYGTLIFASTVGVKTFGNIIINSTGKWDDSSNEAITINGNIQNDGICTEGTAVYTFAGTGKTISGTSGLAFPRATINGTYTNNITAAAGFEVSIVFTGTGTLIQGANSILKIGDNNVGVNFTLNAKANGNTVEYNRAGAQNIKDPLNSRYYNLTISGNNIKTFTIASVIIMGDLTVNGATLRTLAGSSTTVKGNWINSGTYDFTTNVTNTVILDSTLHQTITNTLEQSFYNLTISKTGGSITLNNNVTVNNTLTMSAGNSTGIITSSNKITLGTSIANIGTLTYNNGTTIIGNIERWINGTVGANYLFPVGSASYYAPAAFITTIAPTVQGSLIVAFIASAPLNNGLPLDDNGILQYNTLCEGYWTLIAANSFEHSNYELDLTGYGFSSYTIDAGTRMLKRADAGSPWYGTNGNPGAGAGDPGANVAPTVKRINVNGATAHFCFVDDTPCTPPVPSAITGLQNVCINDAGVAYSVDFHAGSEWVWTITGGTQAGGGNTNSITVNWGSAGMAGNVRVVEQYSTPPACQSNPVDLPVNINPFPTSSITGSTSVIEYSLNKPYSVTNNTGYTYTWSITNGTISSGQGNSTVYVNWGGPGPLSGKVEVIGKYGACPDAAMQSLDVSINPVIYSVQTGNWTTPATWDCNCIPNPTQRVKVLNGHIVTLTANTTITDLAIATGGMLNDGGFNLNVTGDFTVDGNYSFISNRTLTLSGSNATIDGTGTISGGTGSSINITTSKAISTSADIHVTGGAANININTIGAGVTVTNNGIFSIAGNIIGANATTSRWINAAGSTLNVGGALLATGVLQADATGNTINYNGAAAQTTKVPSGSYYNLKVTSGNTVSLGGNTTVANDFTIAGGTVLLGTNSITVNNIANITGTLDDNNATGTNIFKDITISTGGILQANAVASAFAANGNLTMTGGTITSAGGGSTTCSIAGTFTVPSGTASIDAATFSITGDASIAGTLNITSVTGTKTFANLTINPGGVLSGNLSITGNWSNSGAYTYGTGTVTFTESNAQSITNSSGETFYNLTVNKTGGSITLANNVNVNNTLNMTSGNINCGTNTLTLGTGLVTTGTLIYTSGNITGKFKRWVNSTGAGILFPVGTASYYRPALITFTNLAGGTLIVEFIVADPGSSGLPLINDGGFDINNQYTEGYWDFTVGDGLTSNDYALELIGNGFTSYTIQPSTRIIKRPASNPWSLTNAGTHVDAVGNTAKRSAINSLPAQFGFGKPGCSAYTALTITGSTTVCTNTSGEPYSVAGSVSNTYTWVITGGTVATGQGTANITVNWGAIGGSGNVQVIEKNNCGDDNTPVNLSIEIHPLPTSAISGATSVAQFETGVPYSVNNVAGYGYTWAVTGGTIASGQSTASITVDWGTAGAGNVYVTVTRTCGGPDENKNLAVTIRAPIVSAVSGNWSVGATWVGGIAPGVNDFAVITTGHIVTMNSAPGACRKLTINGTANWTAANTTNVGVDGLVINAGGDITGAVAGILTSSGGLTINTTLSSSSVTVTLETTAGQIISGTGSLPNLTINATTTNTGTLTVTTALSGTNTLTNGVNSTLNIGGTSGITGLDASAVPNTVCYNGSGAQTIKTISYYNLSVDKLAGTATFGGNTTINNDFTITSGTAELSGNTTSVTGNTSVSGTLKCSNIIGAKTFNDVTINSGGTWNSAVAETYAINGTLEMNGGTITGTATGIFNIASTSDILSNTNTFGNSTINVTGQTSVSAVLNITNTSGTKTFDNLIINAGGTWNSTVAEDFTIGGNLQNDNTFTANTGIYTFTGAGKTISGINPVVIPNATIEGTYTNNGTFTVNTALSGGGTLTQGTNSFLNIGGAFATTGFNASANPNTVTYNSTTAAQAVKGTTYHHLTIDKSGQTGTLDANASVNGDLNVSAGIFDLGTTAITVPVSGTATIAGTLSFNGTTAKTVSIGGNLSGSGTIDMSGGGLFHLLYLGGASNTLTALTTAAGSTINYNRAGDQTIFSSANYQNLTLSGSGTKSLQGATTANGTITIGTGTSFDVTTNDYSLTVRGNWTNNGGAFIPNNGTVSFDGTGAQEINGTTAQNFNNLFVSATSNTTISAAGQTLQGVLLCDGTLDAGGNLTLLSTAAQTALIDGSGTGNISGNITMQRYLASGFGYKYFSSPCQAATVNEFSDDMNLLAPFPTFYSYDENKLSNGWVKYINPVGPLNPMQGYAVNFGSVAAPITVDITGVVSNGNMQTTLFNNNQPYTLGFNLAGNPYPSPVDWDAAIGWTKTNIDDALYYFDATTEYTGTYSSYIGGVSSDGIANGIIPAMQGVFIHVSDGAYPVTGTLGFSNSVRINNLSPYFHKTIREQTPPLLRLTAGFSDEGTTTDPTVIYFDNTTGMAFEKKRDALKLMNSDHLVPNLYSVSSDAIRLSINAMPYPVDSITLVPLGLDIKKNGWITVTAGDIEQMPSDIHVYLHDSKVGLYQDLQQSQKYRLYLNTGRYENRFSVVFSTKDLFEIPVPDNTFFAYSYDGNIFVYPNMSSDEGGYLKISNLTGQVIWQQEYIGNVYYQINPILSKGIYIVTINTGNRSYSRKIFYEGKQ